MVMHGMSLDGDDYKMNTSPGLKKMKVSYLKPGGRTEIVDYLDTFDQLREQLLTMRQMNREEPFPGAYLSDESGNTLGVGLGERGWLLMFDNAQHTYMAYSAGDSNQEGEISFRFHQLEHLPNRYLVDSGDAIEVIRHWFLTGQLSDAIEWIIQPY